MNLLRSSLFPCFWLDEKLQQMPLLLTLFTAKSLPSEWRERKVRKQNLSAPTRFWVFLTKKRNTTRKKTFSTDRTNRKTENLRKTQSTDLICWLERRWYDSFRVCALFILLFMQKINFPLDFLLVCERAPYDNDVRHVEWIKNDWKEVQPRSSVWDEREKPAKMRSAHA